jgi:hypothetical protein
MVVVTQEMFDRAVFSRNAKQLTTWVTNGQAACLASGLHLRSIVQWCSPQLTRYLVQAYGADVQDNDVVDGTALIIAAGLGMEANVRCLIKLGANVAAQIQPNYYKALLASVAMNNFQTARYLIEGAGADVNDRDNNGNGIWDTYMYYLIRVAHGEIVESSDPSALTALLHTMVVRSGPRTFLPMDIVVMSTKHKSIIEKGERLRVALPAHLAHQRALMCQYTSLIAPLQIIVDGYMELTTTEELWATVC